MWTFKKEDIEPFLLGMTTYGTGGGGSPETGRTLLEAGFANGRTFRFVDPDEVPDDAWVCSGGTMGSVKTLSKEKTDDPEASSKMVVNSVRLMEKLQGKKVDYLIPFEVGGSNTPVIMSAAAQLGIPVIDGDGVGRAAPETHLTSWLGKGISLTPMPVTDTYYNASVVLDSVEPTYADEIGRVIVLKGGGSAANAHYFMSGKQMKESSCLRILSRALALGKVQAEYLKKGENGIDKVREMLGATTLIKGRIASEKGVDEGGFYVTRFEVEGIGDWEGHSARVTLKNETMLIWVDDKLRCVFPDYCFMLDVNTGCSIQTADVTEGMEIEFAGAPCDPRMREAAATEIGKKAFTCARFGHPEVSYIPFEELQK